MAQPKQQMLNFPEENDETLSEVYQYKPMMSPKTPDHFINLMIDGQTFSHQELLQACGKQIQHNQLLRFTEQTPYPSQAESDKADLNAHCDRYHGRSPGGGQPSSLPSYLPSTEYQRCTSGDCWFPSGHHSLPHSFSSLDQPGSLHSYLSARYPIHNHYMMPFPVPQQTKPLHHLTPRPAYQQLYQATGLEEYRYSCPGGAETEYTAHNPWQKEPCNAQLSQQQRKVFVTYEADNEAHLKEVIKFVALLRNNGFDTHIDVFEQQLYSISKIDCMERYLNEKDYQIIIVISQKYFETVTGGSMELDGDERTSNTMYIHKQLQSEFIQNGCKNFRVIPVLFPGAKKSYAPSWLQNTHLYSWPRDRDDILRRLMRVEKYKPPPIGPLPTIVSMPI